MKVVLTDEALADLEAIIDFIGADNPQRARSFAAELLGKARDLATMPSAFPLVPRYSNRGIRQRKHGRYLIFYRVEQDRVTIIHILHSARDYEALLFPDG